MAKTLVITCNEGDKKLAYTLEFNRDVIERMESSGFNPDDVRIAPLSTCKALFAGAFLMHHKHVKQETIEKIYKNLPDKETLLKKLVEMYSEPIESYFDEPEEEGNAKWEASW